MVVDGFFFLGVVLIDTLKVVYNIVHTNLMRVKSNNGLIKEIINTRKENTNEKKCLFFVIVKRVVYLSFFSQFH